MRARVFLPVVNILIACLLLAVGSRQRNDAPPWLRSDPFYVPPAVRICHGINAPAVLFRFPIMFLWDKAQLTRGAAEDITDESVFLLGVALLWFFIGRKIDLWRSRHSDIGHLQPRPRLIVDALGISGGLLLGLLGAGKLLAPTHERIPEALLFFAWCLLLTSFFGYQVFADLTSLKTKGA